MVNRFVIHWKASVDSTNNWAKQFANHREIKIPHLFLADYQTAGRGRMGRRWISPPKAGVLMSLLHPLPSKFKEKPWILGQCAAYAVIRILSNLGVNARFKWPNDVWTIKGKICGILPEGIWKGSQTHIIVGIGINLNTEKFPEELRATSVKLEIGRSINPTQFALSVAREYLTLCLNKSELSHHRILEALDNLHILKSKIATWQGRKILIEKIDANDGGLWVKLIPSGKRKKLAWGEIISMENGEARWA